MRTKNSEFFPSFWCAKHSSYFSIFFFYLFSFFSFLLATSSCRFFLFFFSCFLFLLLKKVSIRLL